MSTSASSVDALPQTKKRKDSATPSATQEAPDQDIILYYTNVRSKLLHAVKPVEKPLKLKTSRKDFRISHSLDNTEEMEDIIDDMRPSFWPKKQKKGIQRRSLSALRQPVDFSDSDDSAQRERDEYISNLQQHLNEIPVDTKAKEFLLKRRQSVNKPQVMVDRSNYTIGDEKKKESSATVVRAIVRAWVEEGSGVHVPEVRLQNPERTVLSQLEKGSFRSELPPRPPFFKKVTVPRATTRATDFSAAAADTSSIAAAEHHDEKAFTPPLSRASSAPLESSERVPTARGSEVDNEHESRKELRSLVSQDDTSRPTVVQEYLEKIRNQPIRSYRAFYNATVPPEKPKKKPRKLLQGSDYYAKRIQRSQHVFDHLRFEKQVDIEDFTAWRGKCRGVVSASLASKEAEDGPLLEQQLDVYGRRENPHLRSMVQDKSAGTHSSVWTKKAMHLAVAEERRRICKNIENFQLDFTAATLSKEAMESLRTDVLQKIRAKPCIDYDNALFSKQDFINFLSARQAQKGDKYSMYSSTGTVDVVDAMRSPAEAAFAKYVLSVLPT